MRPTRAMILAAGLGTRMGALTRGTAKPLLRVNGRALVDMALDRADEGGTEVAVVNVHHHAEQMRAHLAGRDRPRVLISDETSRLMETGGGMRQARPLLGDAPVYALNSDAVWSGEAPLPALASAWDPERMDALLHLVPREAARAYTRQGDFLLGPDGRLERRGDRTSAPFVFASAQIIRPELFDDGPEGPFSTNLIWDRLIEAGRLFGIVHRGGWVDVGTPQGLAEAETMLAEEA